MHGELWGKESGKERKESVLDPLPGEGEGLKLRGMSKEDCTV